MLTTFGFGLILGRTSIAPAISYIEDSDATALFAAMSVQPDQTRKTLYNDLITGLKADAVWTFLDCIYLLAAHDAQAAHLNIKNPAANTITLVDAPTFTIDLHYSTDGVNDFLDLNFNPSTAGGNFTQNSACFALWDSDSGQMSSGSNGGWYDGTDGVAMTSRTATDSFSGRINQAAASLTAASSITNGIGWYSLNRSASNATQFYKNGVALSITSGANQTSTALNNHNLQVGAAQAAVFANRKCAACTIGGSLDATKQLALYSRVSTYLTAIGAA